MGRADDVVVLGSGQSAIEVALDTYDRVPGARVHVVSSQFGIGPSEHGPLVNQIFDPDAVSALYHAPAEVRDRLDRLHRGANHGTANPREIVAFHDTQYRDAWLGRDRLRLHRVTRVLAVEEGENGVEVTLLDELTGARRTLRADALVCATGYLPFDTGALLGEHASLLRTDGSGRPLVDEDCRARLTVGGSAGLYLVGQSEHQHGFSTSLLSTLAVRAGDILDSITGARTGTGAGTGSGSGTDTGTDVEGSGAPGPDRARPPVDLQARHEPVPSGRTCRAPDAASVTTPGIAERVAHPAAAHPLDTGALA